MDLDGPGICCPMEERRYDLRTRSGAPVEDVHRHKGLLRGYVVENDRKRLLFWYPNGRITPNTEGQRDLRRVVV